MSLHSADSGHQLIHQRDAFVGHFSCLKSQFSNHERNEEIVWKKSGEKYYPGEGLPLKQVKKQIENNRSEKGKQNHIKKPSWRQLYPLKVIGQQINHMTFLKLLQCSTSYKGNLWSKPEKKILLSSLIDNFSKFKSKLDYQLVLCNIFLVSAPFESVLQKLDYPLLGQHTNNFFYSQEESEQINRQQMDPGRKHHI